jgi:hypothetical protein
MLAEAGSAGVTHANLTHLVIGLLDDRGGPVAAMLAQAGLAREPLSAGYEPTRLGTPTTNRTRPWPHRLKPPPRSVAADGSSGCSAAHFGDPRYAASPRPSVRFGRHRERTTMSEPCTHNL